MKNALYSPAITRICALPDDQDVMRLDCTNCGCNCRKFARLGAETWPAIFLFNVGVYWITMPSNGEVFVEEECLTPVPHVTFNGGFVYMCVYNLNTGIDKQVRQTQSRT